MLFGQTVSKFQYSLPMLMSNAAMRQDAQHNVNSR